jgi:hypothetical protein
MGFFSRLSKDSQMVEIQFKIPRINVGQLFEVYHAYIASTTASCMNKEVMLVTLKVPLASLPMVADSLSQDFCYVIKP